MSPTSHSPVSCRRHSSLILHASLLVLAVVVIAPVEGLASSCKPDNSSKDKITKQQTDEWVLFAPSLATKSWINISMSIVRFGTENQLIVILTKRDSSPGPALFASKGTEVLLGFAVGEPVKYAADQVTQDTRPDIYGTSRSVVNRAILRHTIRDEDLPALKVSLTSAAVDAVRIVLPEGLTLESSVKSQNSERFQQKLSCFFQFAQEKGYMRAGGASTESGDKTGAASPQRDVPFRTGDVIPVGIVQGPLTITSVEVTEWPDPEKIRKAEARTDDKAKLTVRVTYANTDDREWSCQTHVGVLDDKGEEIASGEREAGIGKHKAADTSNIGVKLRTVDFAKAAKLRIRVLVRPD